MYDDDTKLKIGKYFVEASADRPLLSARHSPRLSQLCTPCRCTYTHTHTPPSNETATQTLQRKRPVALRVQRLLVAHRVERGWGEYATQISNVMDTGGGGTPVAPAAPPPAPRFHPPACQPPPAIFHPPSMAHLPPTVHPAASPTVVDLVSPPQPTTSGRKTTGRNGTALCLPPREQAPATHGT